MTALPSSLTQAGRSTPHPPSEPHAGETEALRRQANVNTLQYSHLRFVRELHLSGIRDRASISSGAAIRG